MNEEIFGLVFMSILLSLALALWVWVWFFNGAKKWSEYIHSNYKNQMNFIFNMMGTPTSLKICSILYLMACVYGMCLIVYKMF